MSLAKKVLVRPEMADKSKSKDIIIDDHRTSIYHRRRLLEKLWTIRLTNSAAPGADTIKEPSTTT